MNGRGDAMKDKKPYLDVVEIWKRIPHRYPFLLIDRVDSFDPGPNKTGRVGRKVIARKNVTMNERSPHIGRWNQ